MEEHTAGAGVCLRLVRNGQPLPALGPATGEHNAAVLGGHAAPETVRLLPAASVRLKSALTLHSVCICKETPGHPGRTCYVMRGTARVSTKPICGATFRQVVVHSAVPRNVTCRPHLPRCSVCSPSFPQLWKTLWKIGGSLGFSFTFSLFSAGTPQAKVFGGRHDRQHLGPNPRARGNQGQ